jgi:hypothetical protein
VSRDRSRQAAEALSTLALIARSAPDPARSEFLAALRDRGFAEPHDRAASPDLARAWSRPDIYASVFVAIMLPALGPPEWTAATAAINTLSAPARERRARTDPETETPSDQ